MNADFEIAVDHLYQAFSHYPRQAKMEGCPCCVSDVDQSKLHARPLRLLEEEDLSYYAFKAMTTFGGVEDFKHYLPRIFELTAKRELMVDTFVVLGKLDYGHWSEWDSKEQMAINRFLEAWWKYDINHQEFFDPEVLIELNKILQHLPQLLADWQLEIDSTGFKNYVQLIEDYYYDLKQKNRTFKAFTKEEVKIFLSWIENHVVQLEKAFFKYERIDNAFAERISNALYSFERIVE